ncbi:sugar phosphate isomerase/epimerase family protein [Sporosarcina newyorkensis]|uniref:Sugar phosphate isomerase/epimerase n=1 Tax=Sporosarcina newyorkensis TaxID=759851 RepID=A0A1T4YK81_9BACL|nr:sugar phosphate isomerase/epimerase family protein [Sporosarcina newyorkensis]SKB01675.1 Sugar phosphate isomerase/epimerase [Sporosarcina newyorkensis]
MNKSVTYSDLLLLNNDVLTNIHQLIEYGADKIEIMMDGGPWNEMEELFETLSIELKKFPVSFSIHPPAWDINLTSENKAIREVSFTEYKKAIEFAGMIHADHVVIHPGFCFSPSFNKKQAQLRAAEYIKRLCEVARPLGVRLAIENVGYKGNALFNEREFASFLDEIDETAGYLLDVGHAQLDGWDIPEVIRMVKDRLIALHIHDNLGEADEHLPIGTGKMDWSKIINTLNENGIDCELILEYAPGTSLDELRIGKEFLNQRVFVC